LIIRYLDSILSCEKRELADNERVSRCSGCSGRKNGTLGRIN
jgi:hypothetical protein